MTNVIITAQIAEHLMLVPEQETTLVDLEQLKETIRVLTSMKGKPLRVYDATIMKDQEFGAISPVIDHVNRIGSNPLIGHQSELKIDFIDLSNLYGQPRDGIVAHCCGNDYINQKINYPCGYLSHLAILARAMGWESIEGFLVNTFNEGKNN